MNMRVREKTAIERERDHQEVKQQGEKQWARSPKRREAAAKEAGAPGFEKNDQVTEAAAAEQRPMERGSMKTLCMAAEEVPCGSSPLTSTPTIPIHTALPE